MLECLCSKCLCQLVSSTWTLFPTVAKAAAYMQGSMHSLAEIPPVKLGAIFNVNVSHESLADLEDTVNLLPFTKRFLVHTYVRYEAI